MSVVTLPTFDPSGGIASIGERIGGFINDSAGAVSSVADSLANLRNAFRPGGSSLPDMTATGTAQPASFGSGGTVDVPGLPPIKPATLAIVGGGLAALALL